MTLEGGDTVEGDELLVVVGRKPPTEDLGLETVGLEPGKYVDTDDTLQVPDHRGSTRSATSTAARRSRTWASTRRAWPRTTSRAATTRIEIDGVRSPRVVFTDPQVAAVGHTLASAEKAGLNVRHVDLATSGTAGASFFGRNAEGTTRFIVDEDRQVLAGVTFVGPEVADFVQAATIAVVGEVPLAKLAHAVPPFPARSELWLKFLEEYGL